MTMNEPFGLDAALRLLVYETRYLKRGAHIFFSAVIGLRELVGEMT